MIKKSLFTGLLLFLFIIFPISAANVSLLIMETGLPSGNRANQYSLMLENAILDAFYNTGHIVSNAPIMKLPIIPEGVFPNEAERDFKYAENGGMDYFLIAIADYSKTPNNVSLRLFKIKSKEVIGEKVFLRSMSNNTKEDNEIINKAVLSMLQEIKF